MTVAVKEAADNAADVTQGTIDITLPNDNEIRIQDAGPGVTVEEFARMFDIRRPLISSKIWRRSGRGALGHGSRVIGGVIIHFGGYIVLESNGCRVTVSYAHDGSLAVSETGPSDVIDGLAITLNFGETEVSKTALHTAYAISYLPGPSYTGRHQP